MFKILIGITGASGSIYAENLIRNLKALHSQIEEYHVIITESGKNVWEYELENDNYCNYPLFDNNDFFAPPASGSAGYDIMVICPCSMATLAKIANGISDNLLTRSADVILKERKKLIIVPREMPYSLIHIENLKKITEAGAIVCPASPSFYNNPKTINDLVETVTSKILNLSGLKTNSFQWGTKAKCS